VRDAAPPVFLDFFLFYFRRLCATSFIMVFDKSVA